MSTPNNTTSETYELPRDISEKLTPKECDALVRARAKAMLEKTVALRIETLKSQLDDGIEAKIGDNNLVSILSSSDEATKKSSTKAVDEKNISEGGNILDEIGVVDPQEREQGLIDKGMDVAGRISDTVEHYIGETPGIKNTLETIEDLDTTTSRWSQIWRNPKQFFIDLWSSLKAMFQGDFSKIKEFFLGGSFNDSIRKGMAAMDKILDLSAWRLERWNELLVDDKEFGNTTIEDLWKAQKQPGDVAKNLGINSDTTYINTFVEDVFTPKNYQKLSEEVQKHTGKSADEIKKMKISDFVKAIAI